MHSIRKLNDVEWSAYQFENDKAERRAGIERRQFSYSAYIPERRGGQERRREQDRMESNRSQ
jgi:hypothetical protein